MRASSTSWPLLAAMALASACATPSPESAPTDDASDRVDDYFEIVEECRDVLFHSPYGQALVDAVLESIEVDLEPPYSESAVLTIRLDPVGYVHGLELKSVSSPALEGTFGLFVEAPPLLPRAPLDVRRCLGTTPFPLYVKVIRKFRCGEQASYIEYATNVHQMLYEILYSDPYSSSPGRGWVRVDVEVGAEGEIREQALKGDFDRRAADKLLAAMRRIGSFPPPPEYPRCFSEKPLRLRLQVQGE